MRIQIFKKIKNIDKLTKIIFTNLIDYVNLGITIFNYDYIKYNLSQPDLLGWFLLDNDNNIVGYIIGNVKRISDGRLTYFINYIYILEKYQGYGLSNELLEIVIKYTEENNINFIMTLCLKNDLYKYAKFGFIKDPIETLNNDNFIIITRYHFLQ